MCKRRVALMIIELGCLLWWKRRPCAMLLLLLLRGCLEWRLRVLRRVLGRWCLREAGAWWRGQSVLEELGVDGESRMRGRESLSVRFGGWCCDRG